MSSTVPQGRSWLPNTPAASAGEPLQRYPSGAGGLYSTARDYARFARCC